MGGSYLLSTQGNLYLHYLIRHSHCSMGHLPPLDTQNIQTNTHSVFCLSTAMTVKRRKLLFISHYVSLDAAEYKLCIIGTDQPVSEGHFDKIHCSPCCSVSCSYQYWRARQEYLWYSAQYWSSYWVLLITQS